MVILIWFYFVKLLGRECTVVFDLDSICSRGKASEEFLKFQIIRKGTMLRYMHWGPPS